MGMDNQIFEGFSIITKIKTRNTDISNSGTMNINANIQIFTYVYK